VLLWLCNSLFYGWSIISYLFHGTVDSLRTSQAFMGKPSQGWKLTHLFILYLESGQSGLQLVVPHEQLCLHGLLRTDLAYLQKEPPSLWLPRASSPLRRRTQTIINVFLQSSTQAQQGWVTCPWSPAYMWPDWKQALPTQVHPLGIASSGLSVMICIYTTLVGLQRTLT
jgi:hypothetical protein